MITNKVILEKLEEKTASDKEIREFLKESFEKESEGKYQKKYYEQEIKRRSGGYKD